MLLKIPLRRLPKSFPSSSYFDKHSFKLFNSFSRHFSALSRHLFYLSTLDCKCFSKWQDSRFIQINLVLKSRFQVTVFILFKHHLQTNCELSCRRPIIDLSSSRLTSITLFIPCIVSSSTLCPQTNTSISSVRWRPSQWPYVVVQPPLWILDGNITCLKNPITVILMLLFVLPDPFEL